MGFVQQSRNDAKYRYVDTERVLHVCSGVGSFQVFVENRHVVDASDFQYIQPEDRDRRVRPTRD